MQAGRSTRNATTTKVLRARDRIRTCDLRFRKPTLYPLSYTGILAGMSLTPRIDKGPSEVLRALATGSEDDLREALHFQREAFRAEFGCYPEECEIIDPTDPRHPDHPDYRPDGDPEGTPDGTDAG